MSSQDVNYLPTDLPGWNNGSAVSHKRKRGFQKVSCGSVYRQLQQRLIVSCGQVGQSKYLQLHLGSSLPR